MKYEKPIVRNLGGRSAAGGPPIPLACAYGAGVGGGWVGECDVGEGFFMPNCHVGNQALACYFGSSAEDCSDGSAAAE